jgi:hypothetical protein
MYAAFSKMARLFDLPPPPLDAHEDEQGLINTNLTPTPGPCALFGPLRCACYPVYTTCSMHCDFASLVLDCTHQFDSTSSCLVLHQWHHVLPGYKHISSTSRQHHLLPQHGPGLCVTLVGSTVHSSMIADRLGQWLHAVCSVQAWWHDAACPPTATKPRSLLSLYATIRRMSADTRTCTVI